LTHGQAVRQVRGRVSSARGRTSGVDRLKNQMTRAALEPPDFGIPVYARFVAYFSGLSCKVSKAELAMELNKTYSKTFEQWILVNNNRTHQTLCIILLHHAKHR